MGSRDPVDPVDPETRYKSHDLFSLLSYLLSFFFLSLTFSFFLTFFLFIFSLYYLVM
jgi:hypothetical protein